MLQIFFLFVSESFSQELNTTHSAEPSGSFMNAGESLRGVQYG